MELRDITHPYLIQLTDIFQESACVSVEQNMEMVYVDVMSGPGKVLMGMQRVGNGREDTKRFLDLEVPRSHPVPTGRNNSATLSDSPIAGRCPWPPFSDYSTRRGGFLVCRERPLNQISRIRRLPNWYFQSFCILIIKIISYLLKYCTRIQSRFWDLLQIFSAYLNHNWQIRCDHVQCNHPKEQAPAERIKSNAQGEESWQFVRSAFGIANEYEKVYNGGA